MKTRMRLRSLSIEASGDADAVRAALRGALETFAPKVQPDPRDAAELERRREQLAYRPENGFHAERRQERVRRG